MPKAFKPKSKPHSTTTTSSSSRNTYHTTRISIHPRPNTKLTSNKPHHLNAKHTTDLLTSHIDQLFFPGIAMTNPPSILAPQNSLNPLSNLTDILQTTLEKKSHVKRLEEEVLLGMGSMGGFTSNGSGSGTGTGTGTVTSAEIRPSSTGSGGMPSVPKNIKWKRIEAQGPEDGVE